MSCELRTMTPGEYERALCQLDTSMWQPKEERGLTSTCMDVFLDTIRKIVPEMSCLGTNCVSKESGDPYVDAVKEFIEKPEKNRLFIPLVIEGYCFEPCRTLREYLHSYFGAFLHFVRGGSLEAHLVLLTVTRRDNHSYEVEYYDPKGRAPSRYQNIQFSAGHHVKKVMSTVKNVLKRATASSSHVHLVYHHRGRCRADQSLFNRVDCGFLVMRRIAHILGVAGYRSKERRSIAQHAFRLISSQLK